MEFAVIAPVVFILSLTAIDLCRANMINNTLHIAAYDGARRGILPGATEDHCETAAISVTDTINLQGVTATATLGLDTITVTVTAPMNQNAWCFAVFTDGMVLSQTCTLVVEKSIVN